MSKSLSNTPYNVKSMNGIITLSDGAGTTIENGQITTNDINSSGKITAIEIEASEVLFNDDLDMNGNDILNVNDINTTLINGSAYPPATADTLSAVLANGNSAGSNDINMNSQNITNVNNINGSAYPPPSSVDNLEDTLLQGNSAGATSIDMNSQDLQNVDELEVDNITGRNGVGNDIRLNSDINVNGNDLQNCNFINFSAFTGALYCPNTLQIQAGTGATAGDINLVCGHSTSEVNITGGDLDMNTNNILNATNINVGELEVDNITGTNGVGNDIRLNSDINVNGNDLQNCNFINFSAFTGALYCPNTLQIQAGTGATAGDINLVCGHSTSEVNITGGDLDMNTNNILNCTNINTTTINGGVPSTANTKFIIGNLAYSQYNTFLRIGDLFGGNNNAQQLNMPANIGDPAFVWSNERTFYYCNDPTYRVMFCRSFANSENLGVVLTPGIWKVKFNIGELQTNTDAIVGMQFFVDNTNNLQYNDAGGGDRAQQQKARYLTIRGASNYHTVPQIDFTVYVGAPGIPSGGEVNGGYAKILGLQVPATNFRVLPGYGSWSWECEQLQAFTWNGLYNGFTPPAGRTPYGFGNFTNAGSWIVAVCN